MSLSSVELSSFNFFRPSGSARRGAVSGSRESRDVVVGSETEASRPLTLDSSQGAPRKMSVLGAQRSSAIRDNLEKHIKYKEFG
ncbi:uncharacterized protein HKW66_Vig0165330 [Vigna angularis]|uniref:Uncharacterized protein n=1 Tax=Phaseolus angularis TaxID=3914 RepID=A0A8T0JNU5_PHAAN|nr:uncharacterized protein HKW66_Vig0165330 [Vigna angularis]